MGSHNGNGATIAPKNNRIKTLLDNEQPVVKKEVIRVTAPNIRRMRIKITGTAPYLQCRFPKKAMDAIRAKQALGDKGLAGKKPVRKPRDFKADYLGALHKIDNKNFGIPAGAFRQAAISACRLVGFKMTIAKLSINVIADGYDAVDQTPLVKIIGTPEPHEMMGRNADGGCDLRVRAIWRKWSSVVTVEFDEDQFSASDVFNLFCRIGLQVGVGEGRPDSRNSAGMGMGTFSCEL